MSASAQYQLCLPRPASLRGEPTAINAVFGLDERVVPERTSGVGRTIHRPGQGLRLRALNEGRQPGSAGMDCRLSRMGDREVQSTHSLYCRRLLPGVHTPTSHHSDPPTIITSPGCNLTVTKMKTTAYAMDPRTHPD
ncbi:hypothetical protein HPB47_026537 [Ixodes persulcatus]|uniref:Uncharacterized protein n=1 Tax=Ixodes persulcatus TaxID=34615 RepID=A0AC60Q0B8_IXOPE|nr:hypothetical protein HPB47_026537 [Ixodes persulcatus]